MYQVCQERGGREKEKSKAVSFKRADVCLMSVAVVAGVIDVWRQLTGGGQVNEGFGWGLPFSLGWQGEIGSWLTWVSLLVIGWLVYWWVKSEKQGEKIGLWWLILGGLVNWWVRFWRGGVVDYLCLTGLCFNLADILITGGFLLVVKENWWKKEK